MSTPDEIYLFDYDGETVWADIDESHELDNAVKYIKIDKYNELEEESISLLALITEQEKSLAKLEQQNADLKAKLAEYTKFHTALNQIKADAINEFKAHVKSGLKVLNEPSWQNKRKLVIDDNTYIEITLSEFDDYANKLRGEKR